jgi:hypothetical protein
MAESHWGLVSVADWTDRYVTAYIDLLQRFERNRAAIVTMAGEDWYEYVIHWYGELGQALATGALGGTVLTAVATG